MKRCTILHCHREIFGNNLCRTHYAQEHRHGTVLGGPKGENIKSATCLTKGCHRAIQYNGLCRRHNQETLKMGKRPQAQERNQQRNERRHSTRQPRCRVKGCITHAESRGYCFRHYMRFRKQGILDAEPTNDIFINRKTRKHEEQSSIR